MSVTLPDEFVLWMLHG